MASSNWKILFSSKLRNSLCNLKTLLVLGGLVHLTSTLIVILAGMYRLVPSWISETGTLKEDSTKAFSKLELLSVEIFQGNLWVLVDSAHPIFIRIYSISHSIFSGIFGNNILTIELVNLSLFLCTLYLVCKIGAQLFDQTVGFSSSYLLMLFPSLVLHFTQPIKDPIYITIFLLFLFQLLKLIKKKIQIRSIINHLILTIGPFMMLWFLRDRMFLIFFGVILIAFAIIVVRTVSDSGFRTSLIPMVGLLLVAIATPVYLSGFVRTESASVTPQQIESDRIQRRRPLKQRFYNEQVRSGKATAVIRVNTTRYNYLVEYPNAGSSIDSDVVFEDTYELLAYLPRAVQIGLFSPFPNTWLGSGAVFGKASRIISGVETTIIYVFIFFGVFAVLRNRTAPVFFIVLTTLLGVTALGLAIPNVGAVYRMRYVFVLMLIILGVQGIKEVAKLVRDRSKPIGVENISSLLP